MRDDISDPLFLAGLTKNHNSQPFWGDMVAKAGAGPEPIPHAMLDPQNLAEAIQFCLTPEAEAAAQEIALKMKTESGVVTAVNSFHRNLPLQRMRCSVIPGQPAAWAYTRKKQSLTLSKAAMNVLIEYKRIDTNQVKWYVYLHFLLPCCD